MRRGEGGGPGAKGAVQIMVPARGRTGAVEPSGRASSRAAPRPRTAVRAHTKVPRSAPSAAPRFRSAPQPVPRGSPRRIAVRVAAQTSRHRPRARNAQRRRRPTVAPPQRPQNEKQRTLLEVVVRLGGDVVVGEVLLAVEVDHLGLDLAVLHVHLVADEHDGDVLAHAHEVAVPVRHALVRDAARHVEHDDGALGLDVVAVAQARVLLLAGRVPARGERRYEGGERGVAGWRRSIGGEALTHHTLKTILPCCVEKSIGCTSAPTVATYFFSNSAEEERRRRRGE